MSDTAYDSTLDTQTHMINVRELLFYILINLGRRLTEHDLSKLESPEKDMFDKFTPLLRSLTYGSDEYKQALADMGPALEHHYAVNTHHPEHFQPVIDDEIDEMKAYLENLRVEDPAYKWIQSYCNERESRLNGMTLLDVIEMVADWKAAGMRHANGNFAESLEINWKRFKISDQLQEIIINTAQELGWL